MNVDLLVRNATVIDLVDNVMDVMDVAIKNQTIFKKGKNLSDLQAAQEIDAKGCLVMPGLIDLHMHLFENSGESGLRADVSMLPYGVTTGVDAGSAGISNYELFSKYIVHHSLTEIKSFLNVSPAGQAMVRHYPETVDPKVFKAESIAEMVEKHSGEIIGLKVRISRQIVKEFGLEPLQAAINIGEAVGLSIMVHTTDPPDEVDRILDILRPGDIFSHCFHGTGYNILGDDGKIKSCVYEARKKGIIFDVANGLSHFVFKVAQQALKENFFPDTISTDLTDRALCKAPVHSLPFIMSKFLSMGMPLAEVVRAATLRPAQVIGIDDEIGTLREGSRADVSVFRLEEDKNIRFYDTKGDYFDGNKMLIPQVTIREGKILYRQLNI